MGGRRTMTAAALLTALRGRRVEVYVADSRLRYRGPSGALDDDLRRAAAEHQSELLALLTWDAAAADAELRQALAVIDAALAETWLSAAQRNVVGAFKVQVETYHACR